MCLHPSSSSPLETKKKTFPRTRFPTFSIRFPSENCQPYSQANLPLFRVSQHFASSASRARERRRKIVVRQRRLFVTADKKPFHGISSDYFAGWTGVGPFRSRFETQFPSSHNCYHFPVFERLCAPIFPSLPAVVPFSPLDAAKTTKIHGN